MNSWIVDEIIAIECWRVIPFENFQVPQVAQKEDHVRIRIRVEG
jgi:hypothetical protein